MLHRVRLFVDEATVLAEGDELALVVTDHAGATWVEGAPPPTA